MSGIKLAAIVLLALGIGVRPDTDCRKKAEPPASAPATPDAFATRVRPVLAAKCSPCHEPGGKMYARLPFDRAETIATHPEGVLKRLRGADREAVETWLASLPAPK